MDKQRKRTKPAINQKINIFCPSEIPIDPSFIIDEKVKYLIIFKKPLKIFLICMGLGLIKENQIGRKTIIRKQKTGNKMTKKTIVVPIIDKTISLKGTSNNSFLSKNKENE